MVAIIVLWVGWMTRMCARRHYRSVSFFVWVLICCSQDPEVHFPQPRFRHSRLYQYFAGWFDQLFSKIHSTDLRTSAQKRKTRNTPLSRDRTRRNVLISTTPLIQWNFQFQKPLRQYWNAAKTVSSFWKRKILLFNMGSLLQTRKFILGEPQVWSFSIPVEWE